MKNFVFIGLLILTLIGCGNSSGHSDNNDVGVNNISVVKDIEESVFTPTEIVLTINRAYAATMSTLGFPEGVGYEDETQSRVVIDGEQDNMALAYNGIIKNNELKVGTITNPAKKLTLKLPLPNGVYDYKNIVIKATECYTLDMEPVACRDSFKLTFK